MILADTNVLSAMGKVTRLSLLHALFQPARLCIAPEVLRELAYSLNLGRQYAEEVFALVSAGQIQIVSLTDILRALWVEGIVSKQEVHTIIKDLEIKDRMQFKQATLDAILAD